jgi:hypothetical protein
VSAPTSPIFGSIRGTNEFEDHEVVIILGREQPSPRDAERRAMAIWYDTKQPIRCLPPDAKGQAQYPYRERHYTLCDGSRHEARVRVHPDRRVQAVVEQTREAEMLQAIDRLRLIHSAREKTVYILCNIPLDIPVDELVRHCQVEPFRPRWGATGLGFMRRRLRCAVAQPHLIGRSGGSSERQDAAEG